MPVVGPRTACHGAPRAASPGGPPGAGGWCVAFGAVRRRGHGVRGGGGPGGPLGPTPASPTGPPGPPRNSETFSTRPPGPRSASHSIPPGPTPTVVACASSGRLGLAQTMRRQRAGVKWQCAPLTREFARPTCSGRWTWRGRAPCLVPAGHASAGLARRRCAARRSASSRSRSWPSRSEWSANTMAAASARCPACSAMSRCISWAIRR